jgi:hypothetical protein
MMTRSLSFSAALILALLLPAVAQVEKAETDSAAMLKRAEKLKLAAIAEMTAARAIDDDARRTVALEKARGLLGDAKTIYGAAVVEIGEKWKSYGPFVDRNASPEKFAARAKAEASYLKAQLENAGCTFQQAQTYDKREKLHGELLKQAAKEYGEIHQKYHSMLAGLFARLWQGRCFQELDDVRRALGIYNELLSHRLRSPQVMGLQDQALFFRLACLNSPSRRDYALVVDEAREWIDLASEQREHSASGQGIRWEFARGLELQAGKSSTSAEDRANLLSEAAEILTVLSKAEGTYQKSAAKKLRELGAK